MSIKEVATKLFKGIIGIAVVLLLIWAGMNVQKKQEAKFPWRGAVYATAGDSSSIRVSDEFKTVEECRAWAKEKATSLSLDANTSGFTCGTNCTWKENNIVGGQQIKQYDCTEVVTE